MMIEPKVRGFLCTTTHPLGCAENVRQQIAYVKGRGPVAGGPKRALVIGCSAGFGLASRITAAFGSGAATFGVAFERPAERGRQASPGWYNTTAFDAQANAAGLYAKSIMGDAFSDETKNQVFEAIAADMGQIDLFIYSLASPRRTRPSDGITYKSALKTIGVSHTDKTLEFNTGVVSQHKLEPANEEEIAHTEMVMGGEDWELWVDGLLARGLLAPGAKTVAYTYIGPVITQTIYRKGTIGRAKDHLEKTGHALDAKLKASAVKGRAFISANKALVTQASSAIPYMPLYICLLYKVMKQKGIHEGCIEQIDRLYRDKLYAAQIPVDDQGRIRVDDWEFRDDVQKEVEALWHQVTTENVGTLGDLEGYRTEFLKLYGFKVDGIDYSADVPESAI
jgi:enoyl-[acyl-carrier protein] reductase / trans-2-enoyl-CoA reductase (NAD+)